MPGHKYECENLDDDVADIPMGRTRIDFVVRTGPKYPGNGNVSYSGTITQEVIRVLIDRMEYVDGQSEEADGVNADLSHHWNERVIGHLRAALRALEIRAAHERSDVDAAEQITTIHRIEAAPTCVRCGHVACRRPEHQR